MKALVILLLASCALSVGMAQDDGRGSIPAGFARVDITPETPVRLAGYAVRNRESEGVAQRLHAKALALGGDEGEGPAVLLMIENSRIPTPQVDALRARLAERARVAPARLVVCRTHTHAGPRLDPHSTWYVDTLAEHAAHIERYVEKLGADLARVCDDALAARRPAHLSHAQGAVGFAANRRLLKDGRWIGFGVQPDGPTDHTLPLLRVTGTDGRLLGVVVSYACHGTTLGSKFNRIHGDWPGCAQERFEAEHPGATAMVLIGCGADANPAPRGDVDQARRHGEAVAGEIRRLLAGPCDPLPPRLAARAAEIPLPLAPAPSRELLLRRLAAGRAPDASHAARRDAQRAAALLEQLDRGETLPGAIACPIAVWSFGDRLSMVFLGGEVVVDYALRLRRQLDSRRLWISAYAHRATPGYVVSRRMLLEGGYEVESSPRPFAPEAEDRLVEGVCGLVPDAFHLRPAAPE